MPQERKEEGKEGEAAGRPNEDKVIKSRKTTSRQRRGLAVSHPSAWQPWRCLGCKVDRGFTEIRPRPPPA